MSLFVVGSTSNVLELLGLCALIGGIAGLVASLAKPPVGREKAEFGSYNRIRFPSPFRNKDKSRILGFDLGSLGPMIIGAGGAIVLVFFTGLTSGETSAEAQQSISYTQMVGLSIAGGAAGQIIFRSLAEGKKVTLDSANQAVVDAAKKGRETAAESSVSPEKIEAEALQAGLASLQQ